MKAVVVRDGEEVQVSFQTLVVGDIIKVKENDTVPADCLVLSHPTEDGFLVDESELTGEDDEVKKLSIDVIM